MAFEDLHRDRHFKQAKLLLDAMADDLSDDGYLSLSKRQALAVRYWLRLLEEEAEIEAAAERERPRDRLIRTIDIEYVKPDDVEITYFTDNSHQCLLAEFGVSFGEPSTLGTTTERGGRIIGDKVHPIRVDDSTEGD